MRKIVLDLTLMMVFFATGSLLFMQNSYAVTNGDLTEDGGVSGKFVRCSKSGSTYTPASGINSCYGGAWVKYEMSKVMNNEYEDYDNGGMSYDSDTDTITVLDSSNGNIKGGKLKGCKKVKYLYRLAPFYYDGGGTARRQVGLYNTKIFRKNGGWYNYGKHGFTGAVKWSTAESFFKEAKKDKAWKGYDKASWDEVSMFCYEKDEPDLKVKEMAISGNTTIEVSDNGYNFTETSNDNSYIGLQYSTRADTESVNVTFSHSVDMWMADGEWSDAEAKAIGSDIQVGTVHSAYLGWDELKSAGLQWVPAKGTFKGNDGPANLKKLNTDILNIPLVKETYSVRLNPGEEKQICSTLNMRDTEVIFTQDAEGSDSYTPDYTDSEEKTYGCVKIVRPREPGPPGGGNTPTAYVSGMSNTGVLFAGEGSTIGWNASATGVPTHRLASYQAVSYLVDANVTNTKTSVSGNSHTDSSPCYLVASNISGGRWCDTVQSNDPNIVYYKEWNTGTTPNSSHNGTSSQAIVVPEIIGAKYCTTLGYKFENWFGLNWYSREDETNGTRTEWYNGSNYGSNPYWYVFDSACSVIAKRPQVAVWNGSVYSASQIKTAFSKRYNNTAMGTLVSGGNGTTSYGSWSEYLAIASSGQITGFGSGSALALGSGIDKIAKNSGSKLTIANDTDTLGYAGITPNKSYVTRMQGHLLSDVKFESGTTTLEGYKFTNLVVKHYENLEITGNITNGGMSGSGMPLTHGSLNGKNMPQMIIFVDNSVAISEDVTQIDAWLIVGGELNTCKEFKPGETGATGKCSKQLQFNGPVSVGSLSLNRTYGAESGMARSTPAEVFNLDPYSYIWAYKYATTPKNNGANYNFLPVYSRELAPRY